MNAGFYTPTITTGIDQAVREDSRSIFTRLDSKFGSWFPEEIISWIESTINMDKVLSAPVPGLVTVEPFQIKPIESQVTPGVFLSVFTSPEQFGKSFTWKTALAYDIQYCNGQFLIVYENKDKAKSINEDEFDPIIRAVPELAFQLESGQGKMTKSAYHMRDNITEFLGMGADITSKPYRKIKADEIDTAPGTRQQRIAQFENLWKRGRRWRGQGLGNVACISSIKGDEDESVIYYIFKMTDMGVYHLRCLNCGDLTINSTVVDGRPNAAGDFIGGLKWQSENYIVIPQSIRVQCPECEALHTPDESREMVHYGDYISKHPEIVDKRGFMAGGLCSYQRENGHWLATSYTELAQKRLDASHTNEDKVITAYWNSFAGVPRPKGGNVEEREAVVKKHCHTIPNDAILAVIGAADTQESPFGWYWIIRGVDQQFNTYLLDCGFVQDRDALAKIFTAQYCGMRPVLAIIDQGGTNAEDVKWLARRYSHIYQYKGSSRPSTLWVKSKSSDQRKLILCDATRLQIMLLRSIYGDGDDTRDVNSDDARANNYWSLPPFETLPHDDDPAMDYITNIINVRDLGQSRDSDNRGKWDCGKTERRDYFDCEKMIQVLLGMRRLRAKIKAHMADRLERRHAKTPDAKRPTPKQPAKRPGGFVTNY